MKKSLLQRFFWYLSKQYIPWEFNEAYLIKIED